MAKIFWRGKWAWARARRKGVEIREPLGTTSAREAEELFQRWLASLSDSKWGKSETPFERAVDVFTEHHLPTLKESSQKRYLLSLLTLRPFFEGKTLQGVTRGDLSEFVSARRKQGVKGSTIRRDLACLSSLYTTADDFDLCDVNPVSPFMRQQKKRRGLKEAPPRTRYLAHEEEDLIVDLARRRIEACRPRRPRTELTRKMILAAIALSIDTGLRDEELLGLEWEYVDLFRNQIVIPAARAKSGVERTVPLLPRARQVLMGLQRHNKSPLVIWHRHGVRFYDLNHTIQKLGASVGVTGIRWHDLRRTCGCRLLQDHGLSMIEVSKWLGHASVVQTERAYAFLGVQQLHDALAQNRTKVGTLPPPPLASTGDVD